MTRQFISVVFALLFLAPEGPRSAIADEPSAEKPPRAVLEINADITLDANQTYGAIVVKKSGVTIDGQGAWLIGNAEKSANAKQFKGTAVMADGVSDVTLKNVNAKGWETGLLVRNAKNWTVTNCNFSDNFHDPDFGWGENGRRGGIVLDHVQNSTLTGNQANRVWDACVLVDSDDNVLDGNDFSHTSNTCLKLWTSCRNSIRKNVLSHGIRISPGEVHARDSTSVLIESGSNDNQFVSNDCTHGGDGIFVRVLNGWCSTGNHFESNDCSFANNNGIECWAPRNVFVRNKANHCSYGFWLGGSDQTRLIENEASYNGLATGHHNSPHLPDDGHAGIVFMFGLNVTNGQRTELAWRDVYVVRPINELGTDVEPSSWSIEDFHDRTRSNEQISRASFKAHTPDLLIGRSSLRVVLEPYAGFRAALTYPKSRDAQWSLQGKSKLTFWLKVVNADVTGWQGGPFIVIHGDDGRQCYIEPKQGRDLMRELDHNEAREGWRLLEIPLNGDDSWQREGDLPNTAQAVSLAFDSWGAPTLRLWIDGLAIE